MRIESEGIVFSGAPEGPQQSATFPVPCVAAGGRWYCTFRAAPGKKSLRGQEVLMTCSEDEGALWREAVAPFAAPDLEGKPGSLRYGALTALEGGRLLAALCWVEAPDPDRPFFNEVTEGLLDTRILLSQSEDAGASWSAPRFMDTAPFDVPVPLTGPILQLPDGSLACQFELNKSYEDLEAWRHLPVLKFSKDGGERWPTHAIAAEDPSNRIFYWDQRPSVLADGSLMNVFWTFDREANSYLNIHASRSFDGGASCPEIWDTGVAGQPGPVFALADGALAMPIVDRSGPPRILIRRSDDGGRTWPEHDAITVYASKAESQLKTKSSMQDAWDEMFAYSVGLPNVAALPGGGALLVYYAGEHPDRTAIRWALIR